MKKETITYNDSPAITYQATMKLRYANKKIKWYKSGADFDKSCFRDELRLQQMWIGSDGSEKWEWIEEVEL